MYVVFTFSISSLREGIIDPKLRYLNADLRLVLQYPVHDLDLIFHVSFLVLLMSQLPKLNVLDHDLDVAHYALSSVLILRKLCKVSLYQLPSDLIPLFLVNRRNLVTFH